MYYNVREAEEENLIMLDFWEHQVGDFVFFKKQREMESWGVITDLLVYQLNFGETAMVAYTIQSKWFAFNSEIVLNQTLCERNINELLVI